MPQHEEEKTPKQTPVSKPPPEPDVPPATEGRPTSHGGRSPNSKRLNPLTPKRPNAYALPAVQLLTRGESPLEVIAPGPPIASTLCPSLRNDANLSPLKPTGNSSGINRSQKPASAEQETNSSKLNNGGPLAPHLGRALLPPETHASRSLDSSPTASTSLSPEDRPDDSRQAQQEPNLDPADAQDKNGGCHCTPPQGRNCPYCFPSLTSSPQATLLTTSPMTPLSPINEEELLPMTQPIQTDSQDSPKDSPFVPATLSPHSQAPNQIELQPTTDMQNAPNTLSARRNLAQSFAQATATQTLSTTSTSSTSSSITSTPIPQQQPHLQPQQLEQNTQHSQPSHPELHFGYVLTTSSPNFKGTPYAAVKGQDGRILHLPIAATSFSDSDPHTNNPRLLPYTMVAYPPPDSDVLTQVRHKSPSTSPDPNTPKITTTSNVPSITSATPITLTNPDFQPYASYRLCTIAATITDFDTTRKAFRLEVNDPNATYSNIIAFTDHLMSDYRPPIGTPVKFTTSVRLTGKKADSHVPVVTNIIPDETSIAHTHTNIISPKTLTDLSTHAEFRIKLALGGPHVPNPETPFPGFPSTQESRLQSGPLHLPLISQMLHILTRATKASISLKTNTSSPAYRALRDTQKCLDPTYTTPVPIFINPYDFSITPSNYQTWLQHIHDFYAQHPNNHRYIFFLLTKISPHSTDESWTHINSFTARFAQTRHNHLHAVHYVRDALQLGRYAFGIPDLTSAAGKARVALLELRPELAPDTPRFDSVASLTSLTSDHLEVVSDSGSLPFTLDDSFSDGHLMVAYHKQTTTSANLSLLNSFNRDGFQESVGQGICQEILYCPPTDDGDAFQETVFKHLSGGLQSPHDTPFLIYPVIDLQIPQPYHFTIVFSSHHSHYLLRFLLPAPLLIHAVHGCHNELRIALPATDHLKEARDHADYLEQVLSQGNLDHNADGGEPPFLAFYHSPDQIHWLGSRPTYQRAMTPTVTHRPTSTLQDASPQLIYYVGLSPTMKISALKHILNFLKVPQPDSPSTNACWVRPSPTAPPLLQLTIDPSHHTTLVQRASLAGNTVAITEVFPHPPPSTTRPAFQTFPKPQFPLPTNISAAQRTFTIPAHHLRRFPKLQPLTSSILKKNDAPPTNMVDDAQTEVEGEWQTANKHRRGRGGGRGRGGKGNSGRGGGIDSSTTSDPARTRTEDTDMPPPNSTHPPSSEPEQKQSTPSDALTDSRDSNHTSSDSSSSSSSNAFLTTTSAPEDASLYNHFNPNLTDGKCSLRTAAHVLRLSLDDMLRAYTTYVTTRLATIAAYRADWTAAYSAIEYTVFAANQRTTPEAKVRQNWEIALELEAATLPDVLRDVARLTASDDNSEWRSNPAASGPGCLADFIRAEMNARQHPVTIASTSSDSPPTSTAAGETTRLTNGQLAQFLRTTSALGRVETQRALSEHTLVIFVGVGNHWHVLSPSTLPPPLSSPSVPPAPCIDTSVEVNAPESLGAATRPLPTSPTTFAERKLYDGHSDNEPPPAKRQMTGPARPQKSKNALDMLMKARSSTAPPTSTKRASSSITATPTRMEVRPDGQGPTTRAMRTAKRAQTNTRPPRPLFNSDPR